MFSYSMSMFPIPCMSMFNVPYTMHVNVPYTMHVNVPHSMHVDVPHTMHVDVPHTMLSMFPLYYVSVFHFVFHSLLSLLQEVLKFCSQLGPWLDGATTGLPESLRHIKQQSTHTHTHTHSRQSYMYVWWHKYIHVSNTCGPFTAATTFVKTLKRQIAIMELAKVVHVYTVYTNSMCIYL